MSLYSVQHPSIPANSLSGGGGVTYSTSDPVAAPAGNSGWHLNTATRIMWVWDSSDESWHESHEVP